MEAGKAEEAPAVEEEPKAEEAPTMEDEIEDFIESKTEANEATEE